MPHWLTDLGRWGARPAIVTQDLVTITYEELDARLAGLVDRLGADRQLVLIEAKNELEPLLWYLACLRGGHPVMLVPSDRNDIAGLLDTYRPNVHVAKIGDAWRVDRDRERRTVTAPGSRRAAVDLRVDRHREVRAALARQRHGERRVDRRVPRDHG